MLSNSGLREFVLMGGYSIIDRLVRSARFVEANGLMNIWLARVTATQDLMAVQQFAHDGLDRKRFWAIAQLLEESLTRPDASLSARFEMQASSYLALYRTRQTFSDARLGTNTFERAQSNWAVSSVGTNRLDELATRSRNEALRLFSQLEQPTTAQKSLEAKVRSANGKAEPGKSGRESRVQSVAAMAAGPLFALLPLTDPCSSGVGAPPV